MVGLVERFAAQSSSQQPASNKLAQSALTTKVDQTGTAALMTPQEDSKTTQVNTLSIVPASEQRDEEESRGEDSPIREGCSVSMAALTAIPMLTALVTVLNRQNVQLVAQNDSNFDAAMQDAKIQNATGIAIAKLITSHLQRNNTLDGYAIAMGTFGLGSCAALAFYISQLAKTNLANFHMPERLRDCACPVPTSLAGLGTGIIGGMAWAAGYTVAGPMTIAIGLANVAVSVIPPKAIATCAQATRSAALGVCRKVSSCFTSCFSFCKAKCVGEANPEADPSET